MFFSDLSIVSLVPCLVKPGNETAAEEHRSRISSDRKLQLTYFACLCIMLSFVD